jgi:hypothetical protein
MKTYQKKKAKPNSPGPGYRTASSFIGKQFGKKTPKATFKRTNFKTQHRG